jgi:hypothetical protein
MLKELEKKMWDFILACRKRGLVVGITSTDRRGIEQAALFAQGRYPMEVVNAYRKEAGMYLLKDVKENIVVTKTMASQHLLGRAFDIVLGAKKHYDLKVDQNKADGPDYKEAAEIGRKIGLVPGIDFGDPCHYQLS